MRFLLLVFFILNSRFVFANQDNKCEGFLPPLVPQKVLPNIIKPDLGQEYTFTANLKGQNIPVKYSKYRATTAPRKGTIIFLCGGPGVPCTGTRPPGIPSDYDAVTLDYLGIGRNSKHNKPEYMAIESQGNIVAQMAERLKEPNLIIFAQSFGTTVATVAGSLIDNVASDTKKTVLKGVVLEGVVGPNTGESYSEGYLTVAKHVWSYLTPKQKNHFKEQYVEAVRGLSSEEKFRIDAMIVTNMQYGTKAMIEFLKNVDSQQLRSAVQSDYYTNFINRPGVRDIFQAAGCQIHFKDSEKGIKIFDDTVDLITIGDGADKICKCRTVANNFNPNDHQIKAPIVYINGGQDPATPLAGARKHMEGQNHPNKVLISNPNGGHFDSLQLLKNCMPVMFKELNEENFENLVSSAPSMSNGVCGSQTNPARGKQQGVQ